MGGNFVTIVRNFRITNEFFGPSDHDIADNCITPGQHRLLRFDFLTHNVGNTDVVVGNPQNRPDLFVFSQSHGHYHLKDFNDFKLFNSSGQQVRPGAKQAFCLMDIERIAPSARANSQFTCSNQGVSAGWADLYSSFLPCQYVVIDGVPDGDYTLQSTTNAQHAIPEDCFSDNTMWTGLRIAGNIVTEIPLPWTPEDRLSLNPNNVAAIQISSRWKVVDGNHWILDFDQKRTAAERAVSVIKHYGLSFICYVGRPSCPGQKPTQYWLTATGQSPIGPMANEDAIDFNPADLRVMKIGERWKITDSHSILLDFGPAEGNAKVAFHQIKKYGFTKQCFVGRPNAPMMYFRKDNSLTIHINYNPPGPDVLSEYVLIRNTGSAKVDMTGWKLFDLANHTFVFPTFILAGGADVRVWTKTGTADAANLYWGRKQAVWNNFGDVAVLRNGQDIVVSRYSYPL